MGVRLAFSGEIDALGDGVLTRGAPQTSQPHLGSSDQ